MNERKYECKALWSDGVVEVKNCNCKARAKGGVAREQDEEDDAGTPHVHGRAVLLGAAVAHLQDLRRHILQGAQVRLLKL